jgi:hypothetical protein
LTFNVDTLTVSNTTATYNPNLTVIGSAGTNSGQFNLGIAGGGNNFIQGSAIGDTAFRAWNKVHIASGSSGNTANYWPGITVSNASVGINNSNPIYTLDVSGSVRILSNLGIGLVPDTNFSVNAAGVLQGTSLYVRNADSNSNAVVQIISNGNGAANAVAVSYASYVRSSSARTDIRIDAINNTNTCNIAYFDGTNIRMGINTTSPAYTLDVIGNSRFYVAGEALRCQHSNAVFRVRCDGSNYAGVYMNGYFQVGQAGTDNNTIFFNVPSDGSQSAWYSNGTGGFGVGTKSPQYRLDVSGGNLGTTATNTLSNLQIQTFNGNASYLRFTEVRDANGSDWNTTATRIQQWIDVTPQGYIQFNGVSNTYGVSLGVSNWGPGVVVKFNAGTGVQPYVGIGTWSPAYYLDVSGTARVTPSQMVLRQSYSETLLKRIFHMAVSLQLISRWGAVVTNLLWYSRQTVVVFRWLNECESIQTGL